MGTRKEHTHLKNARFTTSHLKLAIGTYLLHSEIIKFTGGVVKCQIEPRRTSLAHENVENEKKNG